MNFDTGNDLRVSKMCYNISALQYIQQNGYQDDISNNPDYPDLFSYTDRFANLTEHLKHDERTLKRQERILAKQILEKDYPHRRWSPLTIPEMQRSGLTQYCDKKAFDALILEAMPRHVPSVASKPRKGQTL